MEEFESLAKTMNALQKEKQRQERAELERIKEKNRAEYLRQKRRQISISYHKRQQRRTAELEALKILYQEEVEMFSASARSAEGLEAQRLQLMAQKRELELLEIEHELAGAQSQEHTWLRMQIEQLDNRLEMMEEVLRTQEQMQLEGQLKQMEEERLREEAERIVNLRHELEQKHPPDIVEDILLEMRRLQAVRMAQKSNFNP